MTYGGIPRLRDDWENGIVRLRGDCVTGRISDCWALNDLDIFTFLYPTRKEELGSKPNGALLDIPSPNINSFASAISKMPVLRR